MKYIGKNQIMAYSDSSLHQFKRERLIEEIRNLESNYLALDERLERVININTKLVELLNKNKIDWYKELGFPKGETE